MKKSLFISFFKYQVAAILATVVDFSTLIFLTEIIGVWYVTSTATGALMGAITNFLICRYWAFAKSSNSLVNQVYKYILVSAGSLFLNTALVYLLTETTSLQYTYSKVIVAILVAIFYNFTLQKYFVFKQ